MDSEVRLAQSDDLVWVSAALIQAWGCNIIVANGEAIDALQCPCFICSENDGLLVFRELQGDSIEIVAIESFSPGKGVGRKLLDRLIQHGVDNEKRYVTATTTNDNMPALKFYQRYGFSLFELRVGAVDQARNRLKPEIPVRGIDGVPIRDEIELRYLL